MDVRANVRRIAGFLDDITRHRVVKLAPERFDEYVELTGRYAAASDRPSPDRRASTVGRVLSRGFLFAVLAAREQLRRPASGMRLGLRARSRACWPTRMGSVRASATSTCAPDASSRAGSTIRRARPRPALPARRGSRIWGTGRRPVVDELVMAVALLNAALGFAACARGKRGAARSTAPASAKAFWRRWTSRMRSPEGAYARVVLSLAGGLDALWMLGSNGKSVDTIDK